MQREAVPDSIVTGPAGRRPAGSRPVRSALRLSVAAAALAGLSGCGIWDIGWLDQGAGKDRAAGASDTTASTVAEAQISQASSANAVAPGPHALIDPRLEAVPEDFEATATAVWDGHRTLQGIWIAHPEAETARRVRILNLETGHAVDGALFRRDGTAGDAEVLISSDAASALGMIPGGGTELSIVAIRRISASRVALGDSTSRADQLSDSQDEADGPAAETEASETGFGTAGLNAEGPGAAGPGTAGRGAAGLGTAGLVGATSRRSATTDGPPASGSVGPPERSTDRTRASEPGSETVAADDGAVADGRPIDTPAHQAPTALALLSSTGTDAPTDDTAVDDTATAETVSEEPQNASTVGQEEARRAQRLEDVSEEAQDVLAKDTVADPVEEIPSAISVQPDPLETAEAAQAPEAAEAYEARDETRGTPEEDVRIAAVEPEAGPLPVNVLQGKDMPSPRRVPVEDWPLFEGDVVTAPSVSDPSGDAPQPEVVLAAAPNRAPEATPRPVRLPITAIQPAPNAEPPDTSRALEGSGEIAEPPAQTSGEPPAETPAADADTAALAAPATSAPGPAKAAEVPLKTEATSGVQTPAEGQGAAPEAPSLPFIQAGVFGVAANAERLIARLQDAGYAAEGRPLREGSRLTRVVAGPFDTRADLADALRKIRRLGPSDAIPVKR